MRKIILTGAVLAMLTSVAPMVHAQVDPGVQAKKDYDAKIQELEGKITENKKLIQGDDGKGGLNKELVDLKAAIGKDHKEGLRKEIYDVEKAKLGHDTAITSLNAVVNGDNGNIGLKKLLVGDDGNGGLKNDVKENKKLLVGDDGNGGLKNDVKENKKLLVGDNGNGGLKKEVEDLKRVVGENDTEGLQKSVKENKEKIGKIEAMVNGQNDVKKDIAELGGRINVTCAMSAALAGLKPLQYDPMAPTQVMGSVSTYEGQQAYALGLAHFTSEDLMVHGGVSFTNSHKYMANVGVTYKFGHSAEKSMIPMRYQAGPISSIYIMQKENEMMREKMAQQEERIAQLEEMIMNMKK